MTFRRAAALMAMFGACLAMSACGHPPHLFGGGSAKNKYKGTGERIPVLALNDTLTPSAALKGQEFYIPQPSPITDWPLPGGTAAQSVEHVDAGRDFAVAWREKFGEGSNRNSHVIAPPVAADGKVFVMDGVGKVSAYDEASGHMVWRHDIAEHGRRGRGGFGGGLAFDDGKLYVSSGFRYVMALDAQTGKTLWRTITDAPIHAAPTVANGRVFVESVDDNLMTFDAATGAPGWTYQALTEPARILGASSSAIAGDAVVTAFASGEVIALQAANGNGLWSTVLSKSSRNSALSEIRDISGRPVIYKGDVYAVSHSGLFDAIDLRTGAERWSLPVTSVTTPWAAGDVVYVTDTAGEVVCIAREGGQVYWITDMNKGIKKAKKRGMWSGPILAANRLLVVSTKGEIAALDPKTGAVQKTLKIGSGGLISPIAAGSDVYVVTEAADLIAIR